MKTVAAFLFVPDNCTPSYFYLPFVLLFFARQKKIPFKMKKLLAVLFLLLLFGKNYAQEGEDVGWVARFGAAIGIAPAYVFPDVTPLNQRLSIINVPSLSKGIFVYGASGYAYIMIVDNLRFGGIGMSGSQASSGKLSGLYQGGDFELKHTYSFGGLSVEYTLPFINKIAVSIGGIIGLGTQTVETFLNYSKYDWNSIWPPSINDLLSYRPAVKSELKNNFISFTPTLNVDIPLNRFIAVRVGGGYVLPISESWELNNGQDISGIPNNLKANSFFIQTGIYFGFFAF
jgi:hypothetical protein